MVRLRILSGFVCCLIVVLAMGCGSGSDSGAGDGTETGRAEAPGADAGAPDPPPDPDPGPAAMTCRIQAVMGDHDHSASLAPEREIGADEYGVQGLPPIEGMIRFAGLDEDLTDLVTDAYEIAIDGDAAPRIVDDFLVVTVSRSGGCEEHDFTLVVGPRIRARAPPELDVAITHDNMGDACEAYMTDEVAFDLTALENMIPQGVAFLTFRTPDGSDCAYAGLEYDSDTGTSP